MIMNLKETPWSPLQKGESYGRIIKSMKKMKIVLLSQYQLMKMKE
jgi:hypothetical protein